MEELQDTYHLQKNVLIQKATVISDTQDKTFTALNKTVIGCSTGIMSISGQSTSAVIKAFLTANSIAVDINTCLTNLGIELIAKLNQENILPESKQAEILVLRKANTGAELGYLEIRYNGNILVPTVGIVDRGNNVYVYRSYGDPLAQAEVMNVLNEKLKANTTPEEVKQIVKTAIESGIASSSKHQFGDEKTCGGNPFFQFF